MLTDKQVVMTTFCLFAVIMIGAMITNFEFIDILYILSIIVYITSYFIKKSNYTK